MAHIHGSAGAQNRNRLKIVFGLTTFYMLAEFVGALITNSLALLADAAHMLTDVAALGLALIAIWFAGRQATSAKSYGYYRAEILAALVNGAALFAISGYVLYEAVERVREPPEVASGSMIVVAAIGLAVNVIGALVLRGGAHESLNVEGKFLEVVADLLGSLGVIIAGVVMLITDWWYADPIVSVVIGLFVLPRTYRFVRSAVDILYLNGRNTGRTGHGSGRGIDRRAVGSAVCPRSSLLEYHLRDHRALDSRPDCGTCGRRQGDRRIAIDVR
jgi:cobalt-zinc-cadmium efflux system protein